MSPSGSSLNSRFRGFLPVVIDVETAGFNAKTDALLEVAAVFLSMDDHGSLIRTDSIHFHLEPFPNANLEQSALDFTGIDPYHPFRFAKPEKEALQLLNEKTKYYLKKENCNRAILVGHNASFDLGFLLESYHRCHLKSPFHTFSTLDTATLSALVFGQTVLARALKKAGISFDPEQAHSALYDAEKTAELFCTIVNLWKNLSPLPTGNQDHAENSSK